MYGLMVVSYVNVTKTQSITISTKHNQAALERENEQINVQMPSDVLGAVQNTKYLGVHIQVYRRIFKKHPSNFRDLLGCYNMKKDIFLSMHFFPNFRCCCCPLCSVWCVCVVQPKSTSYRNFQIELPESSPSAVAMSPASHQ